MANTARVVSLIRPTYTALQVQSQAISRAVDSMTASVQHVGVDHRRAHILVAQQLLDRPNIIPVLQQVGRKGVAKRMAACRFGDPCFQSGFLEAPLQDGFVQVVPRPPYGRQRGAVPTSDATELWIMPAVAMIGKEWHGQILDNSNPFPLGWRPYPPECSMAKAVRDEVLTTAETCRYLKVAPRTLYRYIQEKRVPAFKLGKDWRFVKSELDMWLRRKSREYTRKKHR